jgi:putative ABC transport system permease protein
MRFVDLVRFALGGLRRQRVRTFLTVLGVAVGATSLAFSLSLGVGLRRVITNEFHSRPGFWELHVTTGPMLPAGEVPADRVAVPDGVNADRSARLKDQLARRAQRELPAMPATPLTPAFLTEVAHWPDVAEVRTYRQAHGTMRLGERSQSALFVAMRCDRPDFERLVVAGRAPREGPDREAIVPELLLFDLGRRTDAELSAAIGEPLTVEFGGSSVDRQHSLLASLGSGFAGSLSTRQGLILLRLLVELPRLIDHSTLAESEKAEVRKLLAPPEKPEKPSRYPSVDTFTIVGIYRAPSNDEQKNGLWYLNQGAVFANASGGDRVVRRLHGQDDGRFDSAEVKVRPGGDLPAVVAAIESHGFRVNSSLRWYDSARREVTAIAVTLNIFAWISLLVAAIGITNTLVTNVVERTREIGILKALGGSRRQILVLFLFEGTLIGTLGGVLGLVLARIAAGPADAVIRAEIQRQMRGETMLSTNIFEFPLWLSMTTFGAAAIITTLAAVYPAFRASRIEPIDALKA